MYAEAPYVSGEWWRTVATEEDSEDMKAPIWKESIDLRVGMSLSLARIRNVGPEKDTFSTVLECCGVQMTLAPVRDPSHADFILKGWKRILDPILGKYELGAAASPIKGSPESPEEFIQKLVTSKTYIEKYKEEEESK